MFSIKSKMSETLKTGGTARGFERERKIESAYIAKFGVQDYGTEEYGISPERMYQLLEQCLDENRLFSDCFSPLELGSLY